MRSVVTTASRRMVAAPLIWLGLACTAPGAPPAAADAAPVKFRL